MLVFCTLFFIGLALATAIIGMQAINAMRMNYVYQLQSIYSVDDDHDGINNLYDASFTAKKI